MRNRDNPMPVVVQDSLQLEQILPDGTRVRGVNATFHEEAISRMRQGVKCPKCWEEIESADHDCPLCKRTYQQRMEVLERTFQGHEWVGPDKPLSEAIALDDERIERERREREHIVTQSRIVIPRGFNAD
jgi:hypothetical protein